MYSIFHTFVRFDGSLLETAENFGTTFVGNINRNKLAKFVLQPNFQKYSFTDIQDCKFFNELRQ